MQCAPLEWPPTHEDNSLIKEAIVERARCEHCTDGTHRYKIGFSMWKNFVPQNGWTMYRQRLLLDGTIILYATWGGVHAKLISVEKLES